MSEHRSTTGGILAPERAWLTIGLVLVVTMAGFEALAVATIMPVAQDDLGGLGLYGLVFVSFMLTSLVGILVAGRQADRHGPAYPFLGGLIIFAIGLIIGGAAPSMEVLIAGRAVQGLGSGALVTAAYASIGRGYDDSLRPRMFAVLSSAFVVPGLLGPSLSAVIAEELSWRLVFVGLLPFVALAGVFTLPYLWRMGPVSDEAAKASGNLFELVREAPTILPLAGIMALLSLTFFGAEAYLPLALTEVRDQSATVAGLALTAATLSWAAGAWIQERAADSIERRTMIRWGLLLIGVGIAVLVPIAATQTPVWTAVIGWAIAGLGIGLGYTTVSLAILGAAPEGKEGAASASINLSNMAGAAAGTAIGGAIVAAGAAGAWSNGASVTIVFGAMVAFVAVAAVFASRLQTAAATEQTMSDADEGLASVGSEAGS
jgi:MFS family permease